MGNFTDSQILILILIATSNIILIVVAFVLLFSGKKTDKIAPVKKEQPRHPIPTEPKPVPQPPKKIVEPVEVVAPKEPTIKQVVPTEPEEVQLTIDSTYEDENIDYENYKVDEYSDEEYKYATIEEFENAQEENAIISYKELMKYKEPVSIEVEPIEMPVSPKPKTYSNANYGAGEFVSPVFGRMPNEYNYVKEERPVERQEKIVYNNAPVRRAKPVDSNTEFLNALKEFRNNL